jgi:hypothetical protein
MPARIWFVDVAFLVRTLDDNRNHRVKAARGPEPVGTPLKDATWAFELSRWRDGRCCMGFPPALLAV